MRGPDERRLEHEIRHPARPARSADARGGNLRAVGITEDPQQQAEIAAALMGLPYEDVLAEVKKTGRAMARSATASSRASKARSARSWSSARLSADFGNDKRTGT